MKERRQRIVAYGEQRVSEEAFASWLVRFLDLIER